MKTLLERLRHKDLILSEQNLSDYPALTNMIKAELSENDNIDKLSYNVASAICLLGYTVILENGQRLTKGIFATFVEFENLFE